MTQTTLGMTEDGLVDEVRRLEEDLEDCAEIARRLRVLLGHATGADRGEQLVLAELIGEGRLNAIRALVTMLEASTTGG